MKKTGNSKGINIEPLHDRVLIKETDEKNEEKMTDSGIYIPATAKEERETKKGKVVAVGKGKYDDGELQPLTVKVGDTVIFSWGDKIKVDGEEYYVVRESEISAIVK